MPGTGWHQSSGDRQLPDRSVRGMLLADLGAEVIKLEPREGGDPFRGWEEHGYSSNFRSVNRNKRSIAARSAKVDRGRAIML